MTIWTHPITLEDLRQRAIGTAIEHLGIEFLEIGDDFLSGRLLVDQRTRQPFGILHGGVSVVLAETLGSVGATYSCPMGHTAVGLEINANHLRAVSSGWVTGVARPLHRGRSTQVWQIEMRDEAGRMNCVSRITMSILAPAATA
ncbi:hotdog fold thioesterase [Xylophilus sp. GOD-11R]|uniref:hotdog fold thioesterase n=1 Tax=Xylophilus sp. GOD-11R TaxID=3089814 RepID=UPI00298C4467|nr:hotdog fold thioesterase [Xylophilus sp. GOD-11R]WPB57008.1 hotdog fold thioesterase [Xylophilus sp. GOD-11R]